MWTKLKSDTSQSVDTKHFVVGVDGAAVRNILSFKNSVSSGECNSMEFIFTSSNSEFFWFVVSRHVIEQCYLLICFYLSRIGSFSRRYQENWECRVRFHYWTVSLTSSCIISTSRGTRQIWLGVNLSLFISGTAKCWRFFVVVVVVSFVFYSIYKWPYGILLPFSGAWHLTHKASFARSDVNCHWQKCQKKQTLTKNMTNDKKILELC